ncbi:hypothetical protein DM02DRAFT_727996 [Periconia macrospinosa]|uniref:Uncharacterized protein n=1 Tax=Periconia macrospinosa TaxID=97972 RepID=A0A2V1DSW3_9PLEO|nr:hypothetical protein DM02DRAFT_727996 [Periconia macrospinosa]
MTSTLPNIEDGVQPHLPPELLLHVFREKLTFDFPLNRKYHQILFKKCVEPLIKCYNHEIASCALESYYRFNVFELTIPKYSHYSNALNPPFASKIHRLRLIVPIDFDLSCWGIETRSRDFLFQPHKKRDSTKKHIPPVQPGDFFTKPRGCNSKCNTDWQYKLLELEQLTVVLSFNKTKLTVVSCLQDTVRSLQQHRKEFFIPMTLKEVEVTATGTGICECGCVEDMMTIIKNAVLFKKSAKVE